MQSPYTLKKQNLFYQPEADDSFHIFLKKEPYLLEVPHYHESLEFAYIEREETVARIGDKNDFLRRATSVLRINFRFTVTSITKKICLQSS